jgi:hypothetical protein
MLLVQSFSLMDILVSLMMECLILYICRRYWRREGGTERELSELRTLLRESTGLISKMKTVLALVRDEEDHHFAQFHKEEHSMKRR